MEEAPIPSVKSRKSEARSLFKNCFKSGFFLQVPFEIWKNVIFVADLKSIGLLSQTCWGFKELIENVRESNIVVALRYRREGQIPHALKCLQRCAYFGNSFAMFHLGYGYWDGGWGLKRDPKQAVQWFKRAAEDGNGAGMAVYAFCLMWGNGVKRVVESSNIWAHKAML